MEKMYEIGFLKKVREDDNMIHVKIYTKRKDLSDWQLRLIQNDFKDIFFIWDLDCVMITKD